MIRKNYRLMVPFFERDKWDRERQKAAEFERILKDAKLEAKQERISEMTSTELVAAGFMDNPNGAERRAR